LFFFCPKANATSDGFNGEIYIRSSYTSIETESKYNIIPGISAGYKWTFISMEGQQIFNPGQTLSLTANPEICLPNHNDVHIKTDEVDGKITITPVKQFNITGGLLSSRGESRYSDKGWNAGLNVNFEPVSLHASYHHDKTDFFYDGFKRYNELKNIEGISLRSRNNYFSIDMYFDINSSINTNISYNYYRISSSIFNSTYDKKTYRLGTMVFYFDPLVITSGLTYGYDINNYDIYEGDAGVSYSINKLIGFSLSYTFSYKKFGGTTDAGIIGLDDRPLLRQRVLSSFKSYYSHIIIFGISCKF